MFTKVPVKEQIDDARRLLNALRDARLPITEAFWYEFPSSQDWRLVIATPFIKQVDPLAAYTLIQQILKDTQIPLSLHDISLMDPDSWSYTQIRQSALGLGRIGMGPASGEAQDVMFNDAYVYALP